MKNTKKFLTLSLTLLMILGCITVSAAAADDSVTVKMANFNVAGLPNVGSWIGQNDVSVSDNQRVAAEYLSSGFDIAAVQEDFSYHENLASNLSGFTHQTNHTGSFLGGDGMNIFTKNMTIYNETRQKWNASFGVVESGADELANKGILYTVIDLGNGIYVDFYDIHADAYGAKGDRDAREDNYAQLSKMINENYEKNNRAVVVTGDFNHFFHTDDYNNSNMRKYFIEDCGLKDAWVELYNGGDYNDFSSWTPVGEYWGVWDSVERFMYKDGGGVSVTADSFKYTWVENEDGERVSDHAAAECTMTFAKTADFTENAQQLTVNGPAKKTMFTELMWFVTILFKLFANFDQVLALL